MLEIYTHIDFIWLVSFLILGGVVGFLAGLLGVGGGAVMVPVLTSLYLAMGMNKESIVHLALGTSMMAIVMTSFSSAKAHYAHRAIRWDLVKIIGPGIVIGTALGVVLVGYVNAEVLSVFFALFVLVISYRLFFSSNKKPNNDNVEPDCSVPWCFPAGIIIGFVSALVSIGGGSLSVPYLHHFRIAINMAIATSSAIGFIISVTGSLTYLSISGIDGQINQDVFGAIGYIYLPAALCIGIASLFSAKYGAALAHRLPANNLKKIFAFLLIFLSINMLWTVFVA